jgi:hypothetical protein
VIINGKVVLRKSRATWIDEEELLAGAYRLVTRAKAESAKSCIPKAPDRNIPLDSTLGRM